MTAEIAASLRVAADVLERAHHVGVEVDVPWWWLRDRADEPHVVTDPVCVLHLPPKTLEQWREFDRKRGVPCDVCVVLPPASEICPRCTVCVEDVVDHWSRHHVGPFPGVSGPPGVTSERPGGDA